MRLTFRNLESSFESWTYRSGFLKQIALLERKRFIEGRSRAVDARIYRLTSHGRLHALGGRDPAAEWSRPWDGLWRLVIFDLPASQNSQRRRLARYLRDRGFGYLQNSVWITPDALSVEVQLFRGEKIDVESFVVMECRPCAGESNAEIVAGAWDFDEINSRYRRHLNVLSAKPKKKLNSKTSAKALQQWAEAERLAWRVAIKCDPLLPERLLPHGYLGRRAWQQRIKILGKARRDVEKFQP